MKQGSPEEQTVVVVMMMMMQRKAQKLVRCRGPRLQTIARRGQGSMRIMSEAVICFAARTGSADHGDRQGSLREARWRTRIR